ncbi:hypothetical protein FRUB_05390 [Fimbriiglobus ruber]|uniref:Uncharacterized protein n=1 Tax=Fimbriiglobus ruber TaxID=1908690 RepID=A0A225DFX9_9BACT|nr:hypothetical protein FRUB_05390 [Fimbriiglobus ruber]
MAVLLAIGSTGCGARSKSGVADVTPQPPELTVVAPVAPGKPGSKTNVDKAPGTQMSNAKTGDY